MERRFYLFKRNKIYYCQLKNPNTGKPLPPKSTGTSDRGKAEYIAMQWLYEGIPQGKTEDPRTANKVFSVDESLEILKNVNDLRENDVKRFLAYFKNQGFISNINIKKNTEDTLIHFLMNFWDFDNSLYIKEKLAHGHSIGRRRCKDAEGAIRLYWKPYFNNLYLSELTREGLKTFSIHLSEIKKKDNNMKETNETLSPKTINNILNSGTVALKWAADNCIIPVNPAANLMKFSGEQKRRGILSDAEVKKLFSFGNWKNNEAAKLGNLLAMQTGMRSGEIVALQVRDLGEDRIFIRHSFSRVEGLKSPKNGEERVV